MSWWYDLAKLFWRYGLAPQRTQRLMKSTVGRFLTMYDSPVFPFGDLSEAVERVGLVDFTAASGEDVLRREGVMGERFAREIIQASTRVNYAQNLGGIHGLETMVCMATDGAMAVEGGNWRIFDKMVERSGAKMRLGRRVVAVERDEDGKYSISTRAGVGDGNVMEIEAEPAEQQDKAAEEDERFDTIILATPNQFSNITFNPPLTHKPDHIPYVTLHVTLFTTPHRLSPEFFNLDDSATVADVPEMVITTLPEGVDLDASKRGKDGVGPAGFWSVNLLRTINPSPLALTTDEKPERSTTCEQCAGQTQYLYKVFSPERLSGEWVEKLLGLADTTPTTSAQSKTPEDTDEIRERYRGEEKDTISRLGKSDITWFHEKEWQSYPYELPRVTFERIRLDYGGGGGEKAASVRGGQGVWYTSGIESFISTMETSALMGKNVAALIVDELLAAAVSKQSAATASNVELDTDMEEL